MPVRRQKVGDNPAVSVMAPAVHVNGLPGVARMSLSEVNRDYQWYCGKLTDNAGQTADVAVDVVDDLDDVSRRSRFGKKMVGLPLQPMIVPLFSHLWHGFQRQFPIRHPISLPL